jgi:hypothetical protein
VGESPPGSVSPSTQTADPSAPVGMTKGRVVTFIRGRQIGWTEKKQQVPPLRYAPVGMTIPRVVTFIRGRQIGWTEKKQQVPPLRSAPVGMTNWRVGAHLGMGRGGWTERTQQKPTRFRLPAFSSTHSASCDFQKAARPLIWTALTEIRTDGHRSCSLPRGARPALPTKLK